MSECLTLIVGSRDYSGVSNDVSLLEGSTLPIRFIRTSLDLRLRVFGTGVRVDTEVNPRN